MALQVGNSPISALSGLSGMIGRPEPAQGPNSVLFTLPNGATVDVNTLPEPVIDQLIQQYGGHGPLLGRKSFLEQERMKQPKPKTEDELLNERMGEYQKTIGDLFGKYRESALSLFNEEQGRDRGKLIEEQIALGGSLRDPARGYGLEEHGRNKALGLSSLIGNLSGQEASGNMDLAKTIENIRTTTGENAKNRQLSRDTLLAGINQDNESRGLSRYLADAQMRQQRDLAAPEEWEKQLGRIKGITGIATDIFNPAQKAYQQNKENKMMEKFMPMLLGG